MPRHHYTLMLGDNLVWEKSDKAFEDWERSIHKREVYLAIGAMICQHVRARGKPTRLHRAIKGDYNVVYRLDFDDGPSAVMRVPCRGLVMFPEEKVRAEVATMKYIRENTTVPVPSIYHWGTAEENESGLGPFIIMDYVEHHETMSDALKDPEGSPGARHILDPNISKDRLMFAYSQMANILLQLWKLEFPAIGSLDAGCDCEKPCSAIRLLETGCGCDEPCSAERAVAGRPLISNMNSLIEQDGVPPHNDAVDSEDDARHKYMARYLLHKLAKEKRLAAGFGNYRDGHGNNGKEHPLFKLWSEHLRPSNVLVDKDLRVVAVIDWEFAYAAPEQFSSDPPWWLLLRAPENWVLGYEDWSRAYETRLGLFLQAMKDEEAKIGTSPRSPLLSSPPLSTCMRESWDDGTFRLNYAIRQSWLLDCIYWNFLDEKFLGENESGGYESRLELLSATEKVLEYRHSMRNKLVGFREYGTSYVF